MKTMMDVAELDRSMTLQLLPYCIFYVGGIVAGSKALSKLPVPVFVTVGILPSVCVFLLDYASAAVKATLLQLSAGLVCLFAVIAVIILDISLPFADSGYSWLLLYAVFETAQVLYGRIADSHCKETDKLYYRNIFSVVVLAPASLYLEEAFSALHFQHRRQIRFYIGCLCSGVLGACLQLWGIQKRPAPQVTALTRLAACLLAVPVFGNSSPALLMTSVTGLTAVALVPATEETEADGKASDFSTV